MAHVTKIKAIDNKSPANDQSAKKDLKKSTKAEKVESTKPAKSAALKQTATKVKKPLPKRLHIIAAPFRLIIKPFILLGRYIHDSWTEIRQVRWPNRKATWKLVGAIFVYSAFFIILVALLDALFNFIFSKIIR